MPIGASFAPYTVSGSFVQWKTYSDLAILLYSDQERLATEPYKLRALPSSVPPRDGTVVLFPVRSLKAYILEITVDPSFVNNRETVFTAKLHMTVCSLTPFQLSKFFASASHFCYNQPADADPADFYTNIHQLRSISVSLLLIWVGFHLNTLFLLEDGNQ